MTVIRAKRKIDLQSFTRVGVAVGLSLITGLVVALHPDWYRALFAITITGLLYVIATLRPRAAVLLTLLLLPFLGLFRRILILESGWTSYDPLLLVGPAVSMLLIFQLLVIERRPILTDALSRVVAALLALALLASANPFGGSVVANLGGLLFVGAPLLWFFIGRELGTPIVARTLLLWVIAIAVIVASYGLWQTGVGFPRWDTAWIHVNGFASLNVGGLTRAFGTFASTAEYATYLAIGLVFCITLILHRKAGAVLAMPVLVVALFMASSRTQLVLAVAAGVILASLRAFRIRTALAIALLVLLSVFGVAQAFGPAVTEQTTFRPNPFVAHQVEGLTRPFDPEASTLPVHVDLVAKGLRQAFAQPLGYGPAATNIATEKFDETLPGVSGTEIDISNVFVSLGLLGGVLFVVIVVTVFRRTIVQYTVERDPVLLGVLGLLTVALGQWLNGGYYAVAPLVWFFIGWATLRHSADPLAPVGEHRLESLGTMSRIRAA